MFPFVLLGLGLAGAKLYVDFLIPLVIVGLLVTRQRASCRAGSCVRQPEGV